MGGNSGPRMEGGTVRGGWGLLPRKEEGGEYKEVSRQAETASRRPGEEGIM